MTLPLRFTVTLRQLARDGSRAGTDCPDIERGDVSSDELRALLEALTELAPKVEFPVRPEVRIVSPHGRFLVQVRDGHVRFSSWSLRGADRELSPEQILAAINGLETEADAPPAAGPSPLAHAMPSRRVWKIVLLAVMILGSNGVTAWMLTRPKPELLPPYRILSTEAGRRALTAVAGTYVTGKEDGDRGLTIAADGSVRWFTFGPGGGIAEEERLTVQGVETAGRTALLTNTRALIEIADPITVTFYRDVYHRKQP